MKLIALDLDGTTLNSKKEMSRENLLAIKNAQKEGHIVMALSGRYYKSIKAVLDDYGLNCPIGADNGASLYINGNLINQTSLTPSQCRIVAEEIEKECLPFKIATNEGIFVQEDWDVRLQNVKSSGKIPKENYEHKDFHMYTRPASAFGQPGFKFQDDMFDVHSVQKFLVICALPEQKHRLEKRLEKVKDITITYSTAYVLEVSSINGHKGYGLQTMANHFQIPIEETVAIGDERNDIAMFRAAGLSIAMGNADEEVKEHSDVVTLTNDDNGVAYAIEKYVLNF
ncbi:Cof-type HAD-IIB family hydrolase [Neobacillus sp. Marseille-QA0830]